LRQFKDFKNNKFKGGENYMENENGKNLSEDQKARINLASAAYNKTDIMLFDEPLTAEDIADSKGVRGQKIFNKKKK
jgi:ABC-type multidrug transport system fused ATPase/permease subunit